MLADSAASEQVFGEKAGEWQHGEVFRSSASERQGIADHSDAGGEGADRKLPLPGQSLPARRFTLANQEGTSGIRK